MIHIKKSKTYRLSPVANLQLEQLSEFYNCTHTELVEKGLDVLESIMLLDDEEFNINECVIKTLGSNKVKMSKVGE